MILNEIGELAQCEWLKTSEIRSDMNLELGEFVIMPNHFHALITIGKNNFNPVQTRCFASLKMRSLLQTTRFLLQTPSMASLQIRNCGSQSKNLASIIRGFKSSVTINARKIISQFTWQSRFHDHIVRDFDSLHRIEQYIQNNPANWKEDLYCKIPY